MVEKFKLAIEQAAKKSLDDQVADRKDLQQQLTAPARENIGEKKETPQETGAKNQSDAEVEGYKMEEMDSRDDSTQVTSSGVEWLAGLSVIFIIGLAVYGAKRRQH